MKHFDLKTFNDDRELSRSVAELWLFAVVKSFQQRLSYSVALSGGRIARRLFCDIAEQSPSKNLSLGNVDFFWADERCVPPGDAESNFALADQNLFQPLNLSGEKIHRLRGELVPDLAVAEANLEIRKTVSLNENGQPVLDLVFLGMGEDGHVASLFPGASMEVVNCAAPFLTVIGPKPPPRRLTLSYAAIAAAKEVWVLASGQGKEGALRESISADGKTPLARVLQSRQNTTIFSDIKLE